MRAYHSSSLPVATLATIRKVVVENQWEMKIKANRQLVYMALAQQYKCVCLCVCVCVGGGQKLLSLEYDGGYFEW